MRNKNLEFVKKLALLLNNRVFDSFEGVSIMFGDSTNHYSWFPGPGEIRLNVYVYEKELNFLLDSVSLKDAKQQYVENYQKDLNKAIEVGKLLKKLYVIYLASQLGVTKVVEK